MNNAGINAVCMFEDETDITVFRSVMVIDSYTASELKMHARVLSTYVNLIDRSSRRISFSSNSTEVNLINSVCRKTKPFTLNDCSTEFLTKLLSVKYISDQNFVIKQSFLAV